MNSDPFQYKASLCTGIWFGQISQQLQDTLLSNAIVQKLPRRHRLFSRGDPPTGLYGVVDGAVRITGNSIAGKESILAMAETPTWFGAVSALDGFPHTHNAVINVNSTLLNIPQGSFQAILKKEPVLYKEVGLLIAYQLRLAFISMEEFAQDSVTARLARRLILISNSYGQWTDRRRIAVSVKQEELAFMIATSRQTINHLLKEMEAQGLIRLTYGEIIINDLTRLRLLGQCTESEKTGPLQQKWSCRDRPVKIEV
jgi:CRP-like cAMP-binding protein